ncbi:hypothetical protein ACFLT7_04650 [candidate division KSB1 bacterium]
MQNPKTVACLAIWLMLAANPYLTEAKQVRSVYGFKTDLAPFQGKSPVEIAGGLEAMGVDAVFGAEGNPEMAAALKAKGIANYAEAGVFVGKELQERFPDAVPIDSKGRKFVRDDWYYPLIPTHPEVVEIRLKEIEALYQSDSVDGVWLDFIRWPSRWENADPDLRQTSFDPLSLSRFFGDTGITVPLELILPPDRAAWILKKHGPDWIDWKCAVITDFVARVRAVRDRVAPEKVVGIFTVPWRGPEKGGAARRIVAQDLRQLREHIDVFSPMVYHGLTGNDLPWIAQVTAYTARITGKPVWPIVQAMSEPAKLSNEEFAGAIKTGMEAKGSSGVIIFHLGYVVEENKIETMKETFRKYQK